MCGVSTNEHNVQTKGTPAIWIHSQQIIDFSIEFVCVIQLFATIDNMCRGPSLSLANDAHSTQHSAKDESREKRKMEERKPKRK